MRHSAKKLNRNLYKWKSLRNNWIIKQRPLKVNANCSKSNGKCPSPPSAQKKSAFEMGHSFGFRFSFYRKAIESKRKELEEKEKKLIEFDRQLQKRKEQMDQLEKSLQKVMFAANERAPLTNTINIFHSFCYCDNNRLAELPQLRVN